MTIYSNPSLTTGVTSLKNKAVGKTKAIWEIRVLGEPQSLLMLIKA
jgi:hypothetical protein